VLLNDGQPADGSAFIDNVRGREPGSGFCAIAWGGHADASSRSAANGRVSLARRLLDPRDGRGGCVVDLAADNFNHVAAYLPHTENDPSELRVVVPSTSTPRQGPADTRSTLRCVHSPSTNSPLTRAGSVNSNTCHLAGHGSILEVDARLCTGLPSAMLTIGLRIASSPALTPSRTSISVPRSRATVTL
jgi:hypothetical protein